MALWTMPLYTTTFQTFMNSGSPDFNLMFALICVVPIVTCQWDIYNFAGYLPWLTNFPIFHIFYHIIGNQTTGKAMNSELLRT